MGKLVLIGKSVGGNGREAREEILVGLVALSDGGEGVFSEFVVVAVVAVRSGALGIAAQVGLVLLVEERVLRGKAIGDGL